MRLFGAVLIISAFAMIGHSLALEKERRVRQLSSFLSALSVLETEVVYGRTELLEACRRVSLTVRDVDWFFQPVITALSAGKPAGTAWSEAVSRPHKGSFLTREDHAPILRIGGVIGRSDALDQQRHLRLAQTEIEKVLTEAKQTTLRTSRLYRVLGVGAGLITVIMLI